MIKSGRLATPYTGIVDCARRTYADEGMVSCEPGKLQLWFSKMLNFVCSLERKHRQRHPILPYSGS
jgi:hypothetical protein